MNFVLPQRRLTIEEYLAWAEGKPGQHELVEGRVVAMAPDRAEHNLAKLDAALALRDAVKAARLPCTVFTDGMMVRITESSSRVPDASVQCCVRLNRASAILEAPLIVVEIVSPSSERMDSEDLLLEYFSVPSIQHYLILHAERRVVVHHRRNERGMIDTRIAQEGEDLEIAPPGMSVGVSALLGPKELDLDQER